MTSEMNIATDEFAGREYPERPFASAAACVIRRNRILVIKRANPPSQGRWSVPGGVINLGETIQEAAEREVREECGIGVETGRIFNVENLIIPGESGRIRFHYIVSYLSASYLSGEARASSEALEVKWVTAKELIELNMNPVVRENMLKALEISASND